MKFFVLSLMIAMTSLSAYSSTGALTGASQCSLASAPADASDSQKQAFPLLTTADGYEAAVSDGSSEFFNLKPIDPATVAGWPNYGGSYYQGNNDVFVVITPSDASLPAGTTFKVIKPLETDPNTNSRPATYTCSSSL